MFDFLLKIFDFSNKSQKPAPEKETPPVPLKLVPDLPPEPPFETKLAASIIREAAKYSNLRETHGKNRSPEIDKINLNQKSYLGAPWCLSLCQQVLDDVRAALNCKIDLPEGVGTQNWWRAVKAEYKSEKPGVGFIGIMQSRTDKTKGHAFIVTELNQDGSFKTFEGNTDLSGDRDGDGAFFSKRTMSGTKGLKMIGFVDVIKAATPT